MKRGLALMLAAVLILGTGFSSYATESNTSVQAGQGNTNQDSMGSEESKDVSEKQSDGRDEAVSDRHFNWYYRVWCAGTIAFVLRRPKGR